VTTETDLPPLPEPVAVKYPDSGLRDDEHALRLWAAHGYDTGGEPLFSAEQLREATAPLQAKVEALRAEVERLQSDTSFATAISSLRREKERAERLAELLDQAYGYVPAGTLADQIHCVLVRY